MPDRAWTRLRTAGALYAVGTTLHTIDHFRRGDGSVSWEVVEVGTVGTIAAAVVLTLIFTGHRFAPEAGAAVGFLHGAGIAAVHWLPRWSVLSDSFLTDAAAPVSWLAVALEVGGAFAVGIASVAVLTRRTEVARA